jgi:hypothetical protein
VGKAKGIFTGPERALGSFSNDDGFSSLLAYSADTRLPPRFQGPPEYLQKRVCIISLPLFQRGVSVLKDGSTKANQLDCGLSWWIRWTSPGFVARQSKFLIDSLVVIAK